MSYNDRLEEAALWVASQSGDTIPLPKEAVFAVLWAAKNDPSAWPWQLAEWARDPAHRAVGWSRECMDATVPADAWDEYSAEFDPTDVLSQPSHADCSRQYGGRPCLCPCHREAFNA